MESQENSLIFPKVEDYETIENILFIDSDCLNFIEYANDKSFCISYSSKKTEVGALLDDLYTKHPSINRIAFISHFTESPMFLDGEPLFTEEDVADDPPASYSDNMNFINYKIIRENIKNVDFLACNTLQSMKWKKFYSNIQEKSLTLKMGASNNSTGNLMYGGDWLMESNNSEDIKFTYFNNKVDNYAGLLSSISIFTDVSGNTYHFEGYEANNITLKYIILRNSTTEITIPNTLVPGEVGRANGVRKTIMFINLESSAETTSGNYTSTTLMGLKYQGTACFQKLDGFPDLTSVELTNATTFGDNCFNNCPVLTSVDLPKATTFGESCFLNCPLLTTAVLPKATTFGKTCFNTCLELTSVDLPKATTFGDNCFGSCIDLTTAVLPNAITFGNGCFNNCEKLANVSLPNAINFGDNCFNICKSLKTILLPNAITFGSGCFFNCEKLANLSLPQARDFNAYSVENPLYPTGKEALLRDSGADSQNIDGCFFNCPELVNLSLPNATTIGPGCFVDCEKLANLSLPEAIYFGPGCFVNCEKLANLSLPEAIYFGSFAIASEVPELGRRLAKPKDFDATMLGPLPSQPENGCFVNCPELANISLPKATTFGLGCFVNCKKLVNLSLPEAMYFGSGPEEPEVREPFQPDLAVQREFGVTVRNVPTSAQVPGVPLENEAQEYGCFVECAELANISLPKATIFGPGCFVNCKKLVNISLPKATTFGLDCFVNCEKLETVSLPEAINFGNNCFNTCMSLKTLLTNIQYPNLDSTEETYNEELIVELGSVLKYYLQCIDDTTQVKYTKLTTLEYINGKLVFNNFLPTDRTDIKILFKFGKILYRFDTSSDKNKNIEGKIDLNDNTCETCSIYFEYKPSGDNVYRNVFMTDIPIPQSIVVVNNNP
jgi:hypothetical protein